MLYIFDVDGTVIEGHLTTTLCEACGGSGVIEYDSSDRASDADPQAPEPVYAKGCPTCKAKGRIFGEPKPYDRVEVLPGVRERITALVEEGRGSVPAVSFALATNQGGVAMGFQTETEVWEKLARVGRALDFFHGQPFSVHVAMHMSPEKAKVEGYSDPDEIRRRKPLPGMLWEALDAHGAVPEETVMVGDLATDQTAAQAAGVGFVWAWEFFGWDGPQP